MYKYSEIKDVAAIKMVGNLELFIPHDESNSLYQELLEWLAEGNSLIQPKESNNLIFPEIEQNNN
jgi:hypothetical protein